jgi:hypothetical protein
VSLAVFGVKMKTRQPFFFDIPGRMTNRHGSLKNGFDGFSRFYEAFDRQC